MDSKEITVMCHRCRKDFPYTLGVKSREGLQVKLDKELPFEVYNQQMLVDVQTKLGNIFHAEASNKFMEEMDKMLAPVPKEMTINKLVETVAEHWKQEDDGCSCDGGESKRATVELTKDDWGDDSYSLKMWKEKETSSSYSSFGSSTRSISEDLHLYFLGGALRISHNQSYNPTCFSEHEAFIFKLYAAGTKITGIEKFDEDDCELTIYEGHMD